MSTAAAPHYVSPDSIQRYTFRHRVMHWLAALAYSYCLATGLAFYTPHLFWLAVVLGGGPTSRFWHPILGLGFWISVATRNQLAASQIGLVTAFLPSFLLSGFTFPIDQMPVGVQPFTYLIAARYYIVILKSVFLRGTGLSFLAGPLIALVIYAALMVFLAKQSFHKSLA